MIKYRTNIKYKSEVTVLMDWNVLNWIQENLQCNFLDAFMSKFTLLGEMGIIWIAIAIGLLISKKHKRAGLLVIIGLLLGVIIGNGMAIRITHKIKDKEWG